MNKEELKDLSRCLFLFKHRLDIVIGNEADYFDANRRKWFIRGRWKGAAPAGERIRGDSKSREEAEAKKERLRQD